MSPTQRSKKLLEERGYMVAIVEKWNPHAKIRQDLFGIIDILGVGATGSATTVGVQTTSASNVAARIRKITDSPALPLLRAAGWSIFVHGWRKGANGRWTVREVDLS